MNRLRDEQAQEQHGSKSKRRRNASVEVKVKVEAAPPCTRVVRSRGLAFYHGRDPSAKSKTLRETLLRLHLLGPPSQEADADMWETRDTPMVLGWGPVAEDIPG